MVWTQAINSLESAGNDDAVLSRRKVLAGIGCAGVFALAGATLLASRPAEARTEAPASEPQPAADAATEAAECSEDRHDLADTDLTEFSAQWRRRRYWRRRYWRRAYWRRRRWRRWRVVCRRRWIRGRLVRVCRRVWWW
jgi:hypothetical protein